VDLDSKKLRARKLAALASKDLTTDNLRALFRLLDDDGSHEVSPSEIQRGLLLLGFDSAADPVALSRLLVDIDEDKTGEGRDDAAGGAAAAGPAP
jgi:Ca2+-binding EF-hand superfamily protein